MTNTTSRGSPEVAGAVIDEVGTALLITKYGRSKAAISQWRKLGLPGLIEINLRDKFPNLRAFGGPGEVGISKTEKSND